jgi:hemerythrin
MPFATWTDDLVTGIDLIDAQHRALFASVNGLARAIQDGAAEGELKLQLALLAQHTIFHFHTEEALMKVHQYPRRFLHGAEHLDLILKVREIQHQMAKGQAVTTEITRFLGEWFGHHVLSLDLDYAAFIRSEIQA